MEPEKIHQTMTSTLDLLVAVTGLGAIGLVMLLATGRARFVFSALIGVLATLLFASQFAEAPGPFFYVELFGGGALAGVVAAALILAALHAYQGQKYQTFLTSMRHDLEPLMWLPITDRQNSTVASMEALAQRWFVAVSAATGSIVFSLVMFPEFGAALKEAITPRGLLAALLLTIVSFVLIGPIHEFVLERSLKTAEGHRPPPHEVMSTLFKELSWRSALRLALVGFALLTVEVAYDCLGKAIGASSSNANDTSAINATFTILLAGLTPGVVSFYWSAALQLGGARQMLHKASVRASTVCTAVLFYPFGILVSLIIAAFVFGAMGASTKAFPAILFLIFSPVIGGAIAMAFGYLTAGIHAFMGALVLERMTGWPAMGGLLVAVTIASALPTLLVLVAYKIFLHETDWSVLGDMTVGAFGWLVGLIASGFPRIVTNAAKVRTNAVAA